MELSYCLRFIDTVLCDVFNACHYLVQSLVSVVLCYIFIFLVKTFEAAIPIMYGWASIIAGTLKKIFFTVKFFTDEVLTKQYYCPKKIPTFCIIYLLFSPDFFLLNPLACDAKLGLDVWGTFAQQNTFFPTLTCGVGGSNGTHVYVTSLASMAYCV